jgi:glycosyltransferase involved in cell wall biosynthesis
VTPLVSVIVPAKDQEAHLGDTLTSLVGQLGDPEALQVIVVDDGSTDATGASAPARCRSSSTSSR